MRRRKRTFARLQRVVYLHANSNACQFLPAAQPFVALAVQSIFSAVRKKKKACEYARYNGSRGTLFRFWNGGNLIFQQCFSFLNSELHTKYYSQWYNLCLEARSKVIPTLLYHSLFFPPLCAGSARRNEIWDARGETKRRWAWRFSGWIGPSSWFLHKRNQPAYQSNHEGNGMRLFAANIPTKPRRMWRCAYQNNSDHRVKQENSYRCTL